MTKVALPKRSDHHQVMGRAVSTDPLVSWMELMEKYILSLQEEILGATQKQDERNNDDVKKDIRALRELQGKLDAAEDYLTEVYQAEVLSPALSSKQNTALSPEKPESISLRMDYFYLLGLIDRSQRRLETNLTENYRLLADRNAADDEPRTTTDYKKSLAFLIGFPITLASAVQHGFLRDKITPDEAAVVGFCVTAAVLARKKIKSSFQAASRWVFKRKESVAKKETSSVVATDGADQMPTRLMIKEETLPSHQPSQELAP